MQEELIQRLTTSVEKLGVPCRISPLTGETFLPGLNIEGGTLVIDPAALAYPGDILHEAAHIALAPPSLRPGLSGKLSVTPAEEMAALAWSYAAAIESGIDPHIVFHEHGYKGEGAHLAAQYASGVAPGGPGVPMLQWYGMTDRFPAMNQWIRTTEPPAAS